MLRLIAGLLIFTAFSTVGCKKEEDKKELSCDEAAVEAALAVDAYARNQTAENCRKYKAAYEAMLAKDCVLPAGQREVYEKGLASLKCD